VSKEKLVFVENNDPIVEFAAIKVRTDPDTEVVTETEEPLTGTLVECYVKTSPDQEDDDDEVIKLTSAVPAEITILTGVDSHKCVVNFTDVELATHRFYHLDFIKAGKRITMAYGSIKVVNV
jgi:hypothetical protein